jgi:DNA-binding LacI/PurR family transcriptional regulator
MSPMHWPPASAPAPPACSASSFPAVINPVYARLIMAIEDRAYELGYELFLAHTLEKPEREELVLRRLLARRVEGLFVIPVARLGDTPGIYSELIRLNIPTVVLGLAPRFCAPVLPRRQR